MNRTDEEVEKFLKAELETANENVMDSSTMESSYWFGWRDCLRRITNVLGI